MSASDEEQPSRGFKVADRRRFVEGAEAAEPEPPEADPGAAREGGAAATTDATLGPALSGDDEAARAAAEISFTTFVMGLTTQALMHLGEVADPASAGPQRDLPAAKQMIDLLGILRDKTKGNLDATEDRLLGDMLYDLRMRYVNASRRPT